MVGDAVAYSRPARPAGEYAPHENDCVSLDWQVTSRMKGETNRAFHALCPDTGSAIALGRPIGLSLSIKIFASRASFATFLS